MLKLQTIVLMMLSGLVFGQNIDPAGSPFGVLTYRHPSVIHEAISELDKEKINYAVPYAIQNAHLAQVKRLNLSGALIPKEGSTAILTNNALKGMSHLEYLDLSFNNLSDLNIEFFAGVTQLKVLSLAGNNFTDIGWVKALIEQNPQLEVIELGGNRFAPTDLLDLLAKVYEVTGNENYHTSSSVYSNIRSQRPSIVIASEEELPPSAVEFSRRGVRFNTNEHGQVRVLEDGVVTYHTQDEKFTVGIFGEANAMTNQLMPYGGHSFSSDNASFDGHNGHGENELGDDNYGKFRGYLALRAEYRPNQNNREEDGLQFDYLRAYGLYRSRPLNFVNESDENALAHTGAQVGPRFESAVDVGVRYQELHFTVRGGRFRFHGEDPLVRFNRNLAYGGTPTTLQEGLVYGDGARFTFSLGKEEDPDFQVEVGGFDSANYIGEDGPRNNLGGNPGISARVYARLRTFLPDGKAKKIAESIGRIYFGAAGVHSNGGKSIEQNSVMGMVGYARQVGPGVFELRFVMAYTNRSGLGNSGMLNRIGFNEQEEEIPLPANNGSGMNSTVSYSVEAAYTWNASCAAVTFFANYSWTENRGGGVDQFWSTVGQRRIQILQGGVLLRPNSNTLLDKLEFGVLVGTSNGTSSAFGGDPNNIYGIAQMSIYFDDVSDERRARRERLVNIMNEGRGLTPYQQNYQDNDFVRQTSFNLGDR